MSSRSKSRCDSRSLKVAVIALAATLPVASLALADAIDPSMPRKVTVGDPRGAAASERLDPQRTGKSKLRLPYPPVEVWRRHVSGGVELSPVVDAKGAIYVALTAAEVLKLGTDGKEVWRARIGTSPPCAAPIITSDGTIVVVTSGGQAYGVTQAGTIKFTTTVGTRGRDDTTPLALGDGGVVIAAGRSVIELDADGNVRARATLEDRPAGALFQGPEGTIITGESGAVYTLRAPQGPRKLGSLGGNVKKGGATMAPDGRSIFAVVDNRRVVAFDIPTSLAHVRSASSSQSSYFDGPVAVGQGGLAMAATQAGMLLGLDAAGNEKIHVAIEKPPAFTMGGDAGAFGALGGPGATFFTAQPDLKPSPPVIVDANGRVGFSRAVGRVGIVNTDGNVGIVNEHLCAAPIGVLPGGDKRMLVTCRDGSLFMIGE